MTEKIEDLSVALMYEDIADTIIRSELHKWCRLICDASSQSEVEDYCSQAFTAFQKLLDSGKHNPGNICVAEQIIYAAKTHALALKITRKMPIIDDFQPSEMSI
jgi:hypothetical protein